MTDPAATDRPRIAYQPALDGVRAVAVAAVVLFHAELSALSGGYLGVSVFFTLSGFLITTLLVHEREATGRVALGPFFARRARRLLPASMLCIAIVVVLSAVTDWFAGVAELRRQTVGALLQVANWVFLFGDGSYQELFQQASGAVSPLEHYWSLAIEEQFYWVWPLAFGGLVAAARTRRRQVRVLAVVTLLAAVAAPAIAAVWGGDAAYWATPARAAEILVGALLGLVVAGRTIDRRWAVAAPVALAALLGAFVLFPASGGPAYSGALPLVGVASATLLLGLQVPGPVRTVLSVAPAVWLGRISYGVYLYHWPIFVVVDERRTGLDPLPLLAVRLGLTLLAAQISFTLFEQPIRRGWRPVRPGRPAPARRTFATAAAATIVTIGATVALVPPGDGNYWVVSGAAAEAAAIRPVDERATDEPLAPDVSSVPPTTQPGPPPSDTTTPERVPSDPDPAAEMAVTTAPGTTAPGTTAPGTTAPGTTAPSTTIPPTAVPPLPEPNRPVRILVAGDSTAEATGVGLVEWAAAAPHLAQVSLDAAPGCGFVRGGAVFVEEWRPVPGRCDEWLDADLPANVETLQPDVVMLITTSWDVLDRRWDGDERLTPPDPAFAERIDQDLTAVTHELLARGAGTVAWIRQPVPDPLWMSAGDGQADPARHEPLYAVMGALAAERPGQVEVVELDRWLTAEGHDHDVDLRPDGVHWTPEASRLIAEEYLGEQLVRVGLGLARP